MKKIIKNPIFTFIIGIIISGITVYAANNWNAKDIDFEPTNPNWNVSKVDKALDDLYNKKITFGEASYSNTMATISTTSRRHSQELTKGKYLVILHESIALFSESTASTTATSIHELKCLSNNCNITEITGKKYLLTGTTKATDFNLNYYVETILHSKLYYVEITDNSDTIYLDFVNGGTYSYIPDLVAFQVVPISYQ